MSWVSRSTLDRPRSRATASRTSSYPNTEYALSGWSDRPYPGRSTSTPRRSAASRPTTREKSIDDVGKPCTTSSGGAPPGRSGATSTTATCSPATAIRSARPAQPSTSSITSSPMRTSRPAGAGAYDRPPSAARRSIRGSHSRLSDDHSLGDRHRVVETEQPRPVVRGRCVDEVVHEGLDLWGQPGVVAGSHRPPLVPRKHLDLVQRGEVADGVADDLGCSPVLGAVHSERHRIHAPPVGGPRLGAGQELAGREVVGVLDEVQAEDLAVDAHPTGVVPVLGVTVIVVPSGQDEGVDAIQG